MPKSNIDEQTLEPIEVRLEGKDYTVVKLTSAVMKRIDELGKNATMDTPIQQLAILLGVDPKELADVDLLRVGKALAFITKSAHEAMDSGNPTAAAAR